jgi:glycosyltransferase involved in cell wall biosynthesis
LLVFFASLCCGEREPQLAGDVEKLDVVVILRSDDSLLPLQASIRSLYKMQERVDSVSVAVPRWSQFSSDASKHLRLLKTMERLSLEVGQSIECFESKEHAGSFSLQSQLLLSRDNEQQDDVADQEQVDQEDSVDDKQAEEQVDVDEQQDAVVEEQVDSDEQEIVDEQQDAVDEKQAEVDEQRELDEQLWKLILGSQRYVLVLEDVVVAESDVDALVALLDADESVGAVGCLVLTEDDEVFSAGVMYGVEAFVNRNEREWSYRRIDRNVVRPHHRWRGARESNEGAQSAGDVDALSTAMLLVRTDDVRALGSLDLDASSALYTGAVLSTRLLDERGRRSLRYEPACIGRYVGALPMRRAHENAKELSEHDDALVDRYGDARWRALVERHYVLRRAANATNGDDDDGDNDDVVVFDNELSLFSGGADAMANRTPSLLWAMECSGGATRGFTMEAIDFVMALSDGRLPLHIHAQQWTACRQEVIDELPEYVWATLMRAESTLIDAERPLVVVVHKDPGRYRATLEDIDRLQRLERFRDASPAMPRYVVGRSMFETDRVPRDWVSTCNRVDVVSELWLPSHFNVASFERSGVKAHKLHVVEQAIDTRHFAPAPAEANARRATMLPDAGDVNLLSVFKFEARKRWPMLLDALADVLADADDDDGARRRVRLYLRTSINDDARQQLDEFVCAQPRRKATLLRDAVRLLADNMAYADMPALYGAADAFVLPSAGEGFGRPIVEAMALALPTVATRWSGIDYIDEHNAMPLDVVELVVADGVGSADNEQHQWALPDASQLRWHLRAIIHAHPSAELAELGKRARATVVERFSHAAVASRVFERLQAIYDDRLAKPAHSCTGEHAEALAFHSPFNRSTHSIKIVDL